MRLLSVLCCDAGFDEQRNKTWSRVLLWHRKDLTETDTHRLQLLERLGAHAALLEIILRRLHDLFDDLEIDIALSRR